MNDAAKEKVFITGWLALPPGLLGSFMILGAIGAGEKVHFSTINFFLMEIGVISALGFLASPLFSEIRYRTDTRDPREINGERFAKKFFGGMLVGFLFSIASVFLYTWYDKDWEKVGIAFFIFGLLGIVLVTAFYSAWPFTLALCNRRVKTDTESLLS